LEDAVVVRPLPDLLRRKISVHAGHRGRHPGRAQWRCKARACGDDQGAHSGAHRGQAATAPPFAGERDDARLVYL